MYLKILKPISIFVLLQLSVSNHLLAITKPAYSTIICTDDQWKLVEDKLLNQIKKYNDSALAFTVWITLAAIMLGGGAVLEDFILKKINTNSDLVVRLCELSTAIGGTSLFLLSILISKAFVKNLNKKSKQEALLKFFENCTENELSTLLPTLKTIYEEYKKQGADFIRKSAPEIIKMLKKSPRITYPEDNHEFTIFLVQPDEAAKK